jgi:hypothetical protein
MGLTGTHAVLHEYAGDGWRGAIITGDAIREVERWIALLESRPREPAVSGKPLAWLYFGVPSARGLRALRSIGILTDGLRALDRRMTAEELAALRAIFVRHGAPFDGAIE